MPNGETHKRLDAGGIVSGLLLIAVGTLFLLDHLGYADLHDVLHDYWPMFLVILGASRFASRRKPWSGIWLIVVGLWLQATTLHWWGLGFDTSWPLLLIAMGAVMVVRALLRATRGETPEEHHD